MTRRLVTLTTPTQKCGCVSAKSILRDETRGGQTPRMECSSLSMSDAQNSELSAVPSGLAPFCFKPGESGNPGGRPRKRPITEIYERMLADGHTQKEIEDAMRRALKSRGRGNQAVAALKEIADRVEGRPTERVEHTGADGEPLALVIKMVKAEE